MKSIDIIETQIMENTGPADRTVRGLWGIDCFFNPPNNGRVFDYKILLSQTTGQGCAYGVKNDYTRNELKEYVGKDFGGINIDDVALKVSFLDSIYAGFFPAKNIRTETADATSFEKLKWRTDIIYGEARRLLGKSCDRSVVNIGVVGDILHRFKTGGYDVTGLDFDPAIIGTDVGGVRVTDGAITDGVLKKADLAIITGMAITTETMDGLLELCGKNSVKTIIFAETGANLAGYYTKNGADVYLSEHFPFYIFNGYSRIDVCRG